jgi:hypothetical protein
LDFNSLTLRTLALDCCTGLTTAMAVSFLIAAPQKCNLRVHIIGKGEGLMDAYEDLVQVCGSHSILCPY